MALILGAVDLASPARAATVTCATTFTGSTSNDWGTASNWDHGLPASGGQACLLAGTTAVLSSIGYFDVGGLNADGSPPGALVVNDGYLTVSGPASLANLTVRGSRTTFAQALSVSGTVDFPQGVGGSVIIDGSASVGNVNLLDARHGLGGSGTLTIAKSFHWSYGAIDGLHVVVPAGAAATVEGDGTTSTELSRHAVLTLDGTTSITPPTGYPGVSSGGVRFSAATLEIGGPTTIASGVVLDDGGIPGSSVRVLPTAVVTLRGTPGGATFTMPVTSSGRVTIGTEQDVGARNNLDITGGLVTLDGMIANGPNGPGVVKVDGGTVQGGGNVSGALSLLAGTLEAGDPTTAPSPLSVQSFSQQGGTLLIRAVGRSAWQVSSIQVSDPGSPTLSGGTITVQRSSYTPQVGDVLHVVNDPSGGTPTLSSSVTVTDAGLPPGQFWTAQAVAHGVDLVLTGTPTSTASPSPTPSPRPVPTPAPAPSAAGESLVPCAPGDGPVTLTSSPLHANVARGSSIRLRIRVTRAGRMCRAGPKVIIFSAPIRLHGRPVSFRRAAVTYVRGQAGVASCRFFVRRTTTSFFWYSMFGRVKSPVGRVDVR